MPLLEAVHRLGNVRTKKRRMKKIHNAAFSTSLFSLWQRVYQFLLVHYHLNTLALCQFLSDQALRIVLSIRMTTPIMPATTSNTLRKVVPPPVLGSSIAGAFGEAGAS